MASDKIKKYLDEAKIKYITIKHSPSYTAQEIAEITHISAKEFAKTVIVKADDKLLMVVLPAHTRVNFEALKKASGKKDIALASETEFEQCFPGCELGAMPPFGNLFDMPVYVDRRLTKDEKIAFNAGTHSELIKLDYRDFARLVQPTIVDMQ